MRRCLSSPSEASIKKTLHSLGPPQRCSSALLPSANIARNQAFRGLLSRNASDMLAQAPLERNRKAFPGQALGQPSVSPPDARRRNRPPSKGAALEPKWPQPLSLCLPLHPEGLAAQQRMRLSLQAAQDVTDHGSELPRTCTIMGTRSDTTSNEATRIARCTAARICTRSPALKSSAKTAASATPQKPTSSDSFGAASPLHRILKNHRKDSRCQLRSAKHNFTSSFGCRFHVNQP